MLNGSLGWTLAWFQLHPLNPLKTTHKSHSLKIVPIEIFAALSLNLLVGLLSSKLNSTRFSHHQVSKSSHRDITKQHLDTTLDSRYFSKSIRYFWIDRSSSSSSASSSTSYQIIAKPSQNRNCFQGKCRFSAAISKCWSILVPQAAGKKFTWSGHFGSRPKDFQVKESCGRLVHSGWRLRLA